MVREGNAARMMRRTGSGRRMRLSPVFGGAVSARGKRFLVRRPLSMA